MIMFHVNLFLLGRHVPGSCRHVPTHRGESVGELLGVMVKKTHKKSMVLASMVLASMCLFMVLIYGCFKK